MLVNGEWILSGLVSLRPVLASYLTLEFMVIAPCREIPSLAPFPSHPMSSSGNETRSSSAQGSLNGLSLPTTTATSEKASKASSSRARCCIYGERLVEIFLVSPQLNWKLWWNIKGPSCNQRTCCWNLSQRQERTNGSKPARTSLGSILFGTKWLLRRPYVQNPTLHSKRGVAEGITEKGEAQ
jgi:hypothetical protein